MKRAEHQLSEIRLGWNKKIMDINSVLVVMCPICNIEISSCIKYVQAEG